MLPARHRLTHRADFTAVLRGRGTARAASRLVVVHATTTDLRTGLPPRVGFVVSRAVGNAVVRNRTRRRLRAQVAGLVPRLVPGTDLVVRALPAAAGADSASLGRDLARLVERLGVRA